MGIAESSKGNFPALSEDIARVPEADAKVAPKMDEGIANPEDDAVWCRGKKIKIYSLRVSDSTATVIKTRQITHDEERYAKLLITALNLGEEKRVPNFCMAIQNKMNENFGPRWECKMFREDEMDVTRFLEVDTKAKCMILGVDTWGMKVSISKRN